MPFDPAGFHNKPNVTILPPTPPEPGGGGRRVHIEIEIVDRRQEIRRRPAEPGRRLRSAFWFWFVVLMLIALSAHSQTTNDTRELTPSQRGAVGDWIRTRCWPSNPYANSGLQVFIVVTTDSNNVPRHAAVAPEDTARVANDPQLRAFSESAIRAVLSCGALPLPHDNRPRQLEFRFRP